MNTSLEQNAFAAIRRHALIQKGDNVIAALSGGGDSVALFHFLYQNAEELGITLAAAHLDHGLRGEESRRDADFVRTLCAEYGVPLYLEQANMAQRQRPAGQSTEEWARRLRYGFFARLAEQQGAKIATAHTASDNAETVLFHAIRGAGPRGLAGIPARREVYIRPLLTCFREDIERYCKAYSLAYVTDSTNNEATYARNRLRLKVLPELESIHPGAGKALVRMASDMADLDEWLTAQAAEALRDAKLPTGHSVHALLALAPPLRLKALAMLAGPHASREALARMEQVLAGACKAAQLPGGKTARVYKGALVIEDTNRPKAESFERPLELGRIVLPGGYELEIFCEHRPQTGQFTEKSGSKGYTFLADYDKISRCSVLRNRREGDTFSPPHRRVTKTLKKWMNEEGIPAPLRAHLPLLAQGSRVLWVWGKGFSADVAVTGETRRVLRIEQKNIGVL